MSDIARRGFASLSKADRARIASLGGQAAQAKGRCHRFQVGSEIARAAGRKGGAAKKARYADK